jgi:LmbE family N-acetylglucosaminyl deacetylase
MKRLILIFILFINCTVYAINDPSDKDTMRNILIITGHPDDWEIGMAGTAYLLKDKYSIHVIIASDGELGNSWNTTREPEPEVAALRVEHSGKSAAKINATNYFFKMPDGEMYADKEAVDRTVKLLRDIDPVIIFLHWPIDKPDHAAVSAMAMMALSKTGMIYDREIYFFAPGIYVDITSVWDVKKEIVHIHERFNDDTFLKMAEERALYHGSSNHCTYAEGFIPFYPFSNIRFKSRIGCSLIGL